MNFVLYELSTPFLNVHWFLDKINMTGSRIQLYNGILLIATIGLCRLVWGVYQSFWMYRDVCTALQTPDNVGILAYDMIRSVCGRSPNPTPEVFDSSDGPIVPIWLAFAYLGSNTMLSGLNFYWFWLMIEAVSKRFRAPKTKAGQKPRTSNEGMRPINNKPKDDTMIDGNNRPKRRGGAINTKSE